jgi:signal peptidase I
MEPTISDDSWIISLRAGFRRREPRRFDVVRFQDPRTLDHWIVKRIVGLPGEEVALKADELFVNDELVEDFFAYCPDPSADKSEWWLKDDEYVVLGDNRSASTDSRKFGPVKRSSIHSRIR